MLVQVGAGVWRRLEGQEVQHAGWMIFAPMHMLEQDWCEHMSWLQEYHSTADRLQLIPASAKRAGGVQFEIALDRAGASAAEMVSVDVKARLAAESQFAECTWHTHILPQ